MAESQVLTKEMVEHLIQARKYTHLLQDKCTYIVRMIVNEASEIFAGQRIKINMELNKEDNVEIALGINGRSIETHVCTPDLLYNEASLLIEVRNIKDKLYELRKTIKEEEEKQPPSLLKRLLNW